MKAPAFQFYAADYLADERVQLMSIEEEGVYIRLLSYCWREGSIPADRALLARLCKGANVAAMAIVTDAFRPMDGDPQRLIHTRLEDERGKQEQYRELQRAKGARGAEKKKENLSRGSAGAIAAAQPVLSQPQKPDSGSSSPTSSSPSGIVREKSAEAPQSVEEIKTSAENFSTLPKPDPKFCEWFWNEGEKRGWTDPKTGLAWHDWKAAFRSAWLGAVHNKQERDSRTRAPTPTLGPVPKQQDPDDWREFLATLNPPREYIEYQFAPPFLKTDFQRGKK